MKTIELTPRERLNGRLAELLWDSWVALGVAGQPSARAVPYVLDPEALLLATLRFGSVEPRLAGEVADWLAGCGEILSLQRLRNLQTAWLLTHRSGHPAGIARETGWFSKSVQAILIDLEAGGFVTSEMRGKRREFSLNPRDRTLHPELGTALAWQTQGMLWTAFVHLDAMLGELETSAGRSAGARVLEKLPMWTVRSGASE